MGSAISFNSSKNGCKDADIDIIYAEPAQAVLTGGEAIVHGVYRGVAQLGDSTYWKNRALSMVKAVNLIGSVLAQDA